MRKVGGLYFWQIGQIGGSFYLRRLPYHYDGCRRTAIATLVWVLFLGAF